jgi:polyadenylate-binding protein 2
MSSDEAETAATPTTIAEAEAIHDAQQPPPPSPPLQQQPQPTEATTTTTTTGGSGSTASFVAELADKLGELDEEEIALRHIQQEAGEAAGTTAAAVAAAQSQPQQQQQQQQNRAEVDARSVYVGNVHFSCSEKDIEAHFSGVCRPATSDPLLSPSLFSHTRAFTQCGAINRITILADKFTGQRKGAAYIEFAEADGVAAAVLMSNTTLKGRPIKVTQKRPTQAGYGLGGRGGGPLGRGGGRGMPMPMMMPMGRAGGRGGAGGYYGAPYPFMIPIPGWGMPYRPPSRYRGASRGRAASISASAADVAPAAASAQATSSPPTGPVANSSSDGGGGGTPGTM